MHLVIVLACGLALSAFASEQPIAVGSDSYLYSSTTDDSETRLDVYYYKPTSFNQDAPVLLVIPGSGRNAWDYRDAWKEAAEKYGALILSPHYSEQQYPEFWDYNIAGMLSNVTINEARTGFSDYDITLDKQSWIFKDFDGLFHDARDRFSLSTDGYDMFGHSAGGQILHRFALFGTSEHANQLIAANAGWYTLPDFSVRFPFGLKESSLSVRALQKAFTKELVVFLGEQDNASESRGHLARNDKLDVQGLHRFARGQYFYRESKAIAEDMEASFQWHMVHVPGVGHDYRLMSQAAARYLYEP